MSVAVVVNKVNMPAVLVGKRRQVDFDLPGLKGGNVEVQSAVGFQLAVAVKLPLDVKISGGLKAVGVCEDELIVGDCLCHEGSVDGFHLIGACMGSSVGIEKTVNAEVAVVMLLPVVAAVGVSVRVFGVVGGVIDRVVSPLPDEAAHELVTGVEDVPILLHAAGTYAHGMDIFAKDFGLACKRLAPLFADHLSEPVVAGVHLGDDIIGMTPCIDYSLVVNGNVAYGFKIAVALVVALVAARLVAQ